MSRGGVDVVGGAEGAWSVGLEHYDVEQRLRLVLETKGGGSTEDGEECGLGVRYSIVPSRKGEEYCDYDDEEEETNFGKEIRWDIVSE